MTWNLANRSSFRSDTATRVFALAVGFMWLSRPVCWCPDRLRGRLDMCLPRIYLGLRHPSDVLVEAILGIGVVRMTIGVLRAIGGARRTRRVTWMDAGEREHPQLANTLALAVAFDMMMLFDDVRHFGARLIRALRPAKLIGTDGAAGAFILGGALSVLVAVGVVYGLFRGSRLPPAARFGGLNSAPLSTLTILRRRNCRCRVQWAVGASAIV